MVAYQLGIGDVPGSNPGKGENFSMKINDGLVILYQESHQLVQNVNIFEIKYIVISYTTNRKGKSLCRMRQLIVLLVLSSLFIKLNL